MKTIVKRLIAFFIIITMTINLVNPVKAATNNTSELGALADSYEAQDGTFTLSTSSRFYIVADSEPSGNLLQTVQLVQSQFASDTDISVETLDIVWGPVGWAKEGDIVIKLDTASGIAAEGYKLDVAGTAAVTASDVDGLLYGCNMLQKYFRAADSTTLTGFTASDAPDTKERTVMLDCARKYYTKEWICNFIREMSWMGYNTIELHFSEDGGFRMDFWDPAYYTDNYNPENDFSWLCGSQVQSWVKDPYRTDSDAGKYLTTAEVVEILNTAKKYHIDVIPSFDSPAHMDYITWKFEQNYKSNTSYSFTYDGTTYKASSTKGCINYTGKTGASSPTWPYYTTIDITEGTMAKAFIFALYSDIADFFKEYVGSTDFAIGADEVNLSSGYGIKWNYSSFPDYVNDLNTLLKANGYTTRIFNDFIGTTAYSATEDFDSDIEIMYWNSPFNPTSNTTYGADNKTQPASYFVGEGRTIYNCIQTNCYYVLRVAASTTSYPNMDARNPENYNWSFYHSTEESIYNEWYPANVSEHGLYSESVADISSSNLGGAYFLIWNDYAALNTEAEVWNGVKDNTGTSSYTYSLLNRMWSNTIKMWNSDINSSNNDTGAVTYTNFAAVRDKFGYFPGFTSCSEAASLPEATDPAQAWNADHSELTEALENKIGNEDGTYTEESYAAYEEAYAAAETVNADHGATAEELAASLTALNTAKANLIENSKESESDSGNEGNNGQESEDTTNYNFTAVCKTTVNGEEKTIRTVKYNISGTEFCVYLKPMTGYKFKSADGAKYTPLASNDGSGFISGSMKADGGTAITVWYENTPDTNRLKDLIGYEITEQGSYTEASWKVYQDALQAAKAFTVKDTTMQSDIDAIAAALEDAQSRLVTSSEATEIIDVEKVCETARLGKQVGLKVTTSPDVDTLTVTDNETDNEETLNLCTGKVQTLKSGETVKIWLVDFDADKTGTFSYTVNAGSVSSDVEVTVK